MHVEIPNATERVLILARAEAGDLMYAHEDLRKLALMLNAAESRFAVMERLANAVLWLRDAERNAAVARANIDAYHACQVGQELEAARTEYAEALAVLESEPTS